MEEKSSINIGVIILVIIVLYMIWAYYSCQKKRKIGQHKCHPLVGFRPITNLFGEYHPVGHATSTDTSTSTVIATGTGTGTGTTTSTSSSSNKIVVINSNNATVYSLVSPNNGFSANPTSNQVVNGTQLTFTSTIVVGTVTYYQTQNGWLSSLDINIVS